MKSRDGVIERKQQRMSYGRLGLCVLGEFIVLASEDVKSKLSE
jgi:hypothetical protein